MIKMDLTLFGGRGGTAESASYTKGFLKSAMKNADDDDVKADIDAAQFILNRLTKAKSEDRVSPRDGFDFLHESDILNDWTSDSKVAKYDSDSGKLTIEPGKLTEARREYERFIKDRFRQYYRRTRTGYWKGKKK